MRRFGLVEALLLFAIAVSVATYYSHLSQYATADQDSTLNRIGDYQRGSTVLINGSAVSFVTVGNLGYYVDAALKGSFQPNERVFGSLHYTPYLPYMLVQVTLCLALIFIIASLISRLIGPARDSGVLLFLFSSFVLLSFPLLKAEIKILKYDAISFLLSTLAVLLYLRYRQRSFELYYWASVFVAGFAFAEKETTLSILVLIVFHESLEIYLGSRSRWEALGRFLKTLVLSAVVYFAPVFILNPKLIFSLSQLREFAVIIADTYFKVLSWKLLGLAVLAFAFLLALRPSFIRRSAAVKAFLEEHRRSGFLLGLSVFVLLLSSAIFDQRNEVLGYRLLSEDMKRLISEKGYFVSPEMAGWSFTTLNESMALTALKALYNNLRSFFYVVPEVYLAFYVAPLLALLSTKEARSLPGHVTLLLSFAGLLLLAHTLIFALPEPKYNLQPFLFLIIGGLCLFGELLRNMSRRRIGVVAIGFLLLVPQFKAYPAYFGFQSVLRSAEVENADGLSMSKYPWVWPGWGETSYHCISYLSEQGIERARVAFDYLAPFYHEDTLMPVRLYEVCAQMDARKCIEKLQSEKIDFLIISKNMIYRDKMVNDILRLNRPKAVYVHEVGGVEYGWLFPVESLAQPATGGE